MGFNGVRMVCKTLSYDLNRLNHWSVGFPGRVRIFVSSVLQGSVVFSDSCRMVCYGFVMFSYDVNRAVRRSISFLIVFVLCYYGSVSFP